MRIGPYTKVLPFFITTLQTIFDSVEKKYSAESSKKSIYLKQNSLYCLATQSGIALMSRFVTLLSFHITSSCLKRPHCLLKLSLVIIFGISYEQASLFHWGLVTLHAQYNNVRCREPAVKLWQQAACVTGAHCYFGGSMCLPCSGSGFLACAKPVHCTRPESTWWMVTPAAGVHPPMPFSQYIPQDLIYILSKEQRVLRCLFMGHNGSSMSASSTMSDFRVEKTTELNNISPVLVCLFVSSDFCCRSV